MKNVKILIFLVFILLVISTGCKKCEECEYYIMGIKQETEYEEFCEDELEAAKNTWQSNEETGWKCKK